MLPPEQAVRARHLTQAAQAVQETGTGQAGAAVRAVPMALAVRAVTTPSQEALREAAVAAAALGPERLTRAASARRERPPLAARAAPTTPEPEAVQAARRAEPL